MGRIVPRRILVADESRSLLAALRRHLEGTGFTVEAAAPGQAAGRADPAEHAAAIVRGDAAGARVLRALRAVDPHLPVLALFRDGKAAAAHPDGLGADGVLVGPFSPAAVAGACRTAARLGAARRRAAAAEAEAAARARAGSGLALIKRLLPMEVKRSRRYEYPVSVALVAVDRWPEVSRREGAKGAAAALAQVLGVVTASIRDVDLSAPLADERLVVLMPHTRAAGALQVAHRLCARVRDRCAMAGLTVSVGVAGHDGGGTVSFGGLVRRAAEALTRARAAGGDRAEAAEPRGRERIAMG